MAIEVEQKYKISQTAWRDLERTHDCSDIQQGYLMTGDDWSLRVRIESKYIGGVFHGQEFKKATMAYKKDLLSNGHASVRTELESDIDYELAKTLMGLCQGIVKKSRIHMQTGRLKFDVDYFYDLGLYVAEVEFPNQGDTDLFLAPSWFGPQIMGDELKEYSNVALAMRHRS